MLALLSVVVVGTPKNVAILCSIKSFLEKTYYSTNHIFYNAPINYLYGYGWYLAWPHVTQTRQSLSLPGNGPIAMYSSRYLRCSREKKWMEVNFISPPFPLPRPKKNKKNRRWNLGGIFTNLRSNMIQPFFQNQPPNFYLFHQAPQLLPTKPSTSELFFGFQMTFPPPPPKKKKKTTPEARGQGTISYWRLLRPRVWGSQCTFHGKPCCCHADAADAEFFGWMVFGGVFTIREKLLAPFVLFFFVCVCFFTPAHFDKEKIWKEAQVFFHGRKTNPNQKKKRNLHASNFGKKTQHTVFNMIFHDVSSWTSRWKGS